MLGRLRKGFHRFKDDTQGVTAVEFSLLAIPYFMLSLAIIELALVYVSASLLEGATSVAARQIRTGQVQASADPAGAFRQEICDFATVLISCNDVIIDVQTMESYSDFDAIDIEYDADGNMVSSGFNAGGSNDRVLIRTAAQYEFMTPFIGNLLSGGRGSLQFISTIVLQAEPYEFDPDAG
jgi:Flp pilus assembly protein TadG